MIFLHLSRIPIQKKKLKPIYTNQFGTNPLFYNPKDYGILVEMNGLLKIN